MAELSEVSRREKHLLFICLEPSFKEASLSLTFRSENNVILFQEDIYYPVPEFLFSGYELICFFTKLDKIYVCNPHAHQVQVLPPGTGDLQCLGFSYLSSSEEYIVVRLFGFQEKGLCEFSTGIEVMKFGKNVNFVGFDESWKKAKKSYCSRIDDGIRAFDEGPVVDRTMHWYVHNAVNCVLAFDVDDENLYAIDVPFDLDQSYVSFSVLMNLDGKLCVASIDKTEDTPILKIWGLQEGMESLWVVEHTIKFDDLGYEFLKNKNFNFEKLYPSCSSEGELVFGAYGSFNFDNFEKRSFREVKRPKGCFTIGFRRLLERVGET